MNCSICLSDAPASRVTCNGWTTPPLCGVCTSLVLGQTDESPGLPGLIRHVRQIAMLAIAHQQLRRLGQNVGDFGFPKVVRDAPVTIRRPMGVPE